MGLSHLFFGFKEETAGTTPCWVSKADRSKWGGLAEQMQYPQKGLQDCNALSALWPGMQDHCLAILSFFLENLWKPMETDPVFERNDGWKEWTRNQPIDFYLSLFLSLALSLSRGFPACQSSRAPERLVSGASA